MKFRTLTSSAVLAITALAAVQARADNMVSIAITPATGVVTLSPQWAVGPNLAGFHHMAQDLGLDGSVANNFYSVTDTAIPDGGNALEGFKYYAFGDGASTPHEIGTKLTPDSYLALTSADPDVGYGSVNFYLIHRKGTTDYFTVIKPGSAVSSEVTDLKPMSGPGGPDTVTGVNGYFGLTFAASNLGYGLNNFYYLRNDPVTGTVKFGTLAPALLSTSADQFELNETGFKALVFTGTDVGYGNDQMYYLRLDSETGHTILGTLNPALAGTRHTADIANLGGVYSTLTFIPNDPISLGSNQFYTTGVVTPGWQSVSFAAIADRDTVDGSFTVNPTASSGLALTLTVTADSTGSASISAPVGGVYTVTPTAPGLITLQATQAGQIEPVLYNTNMLRQSFTVTGATLLAITTQPTDQSEVVGSTATFTVETDGTSEVFYQWRKDGDAIIDNVSATTATLTLTNVQAADAADYDVVVTNASGTLYSEIVPLVVTVVPDPIPPVITNENLAATGALRTAFSFSIMASGSPTSYDASPLPAGLIIDTATGVISGIPTAAGVTQVTLTATNNDGTDDATLTVTIADNVHVTVAGPLPAVIQLSPGGVTPPVGTVYYVKGLPKGLTLDPATGEISSLSGTTVTAKPGTYKVTYGTITTDENGKKTKSATETLYIVVDPIPDAISGGFEAILELPPVPNTPVGKVTLLVNAKTGAFSGRLSTDKTQSFKGKLVLDPTYTTATANVVIKRGSGLSPYRLDLTLDASLPEDTVFAVTLRQLDNSDMIVATLGESASGVRLAGFSKSSPAPWAGDYTMILTEATNLGANPAPEGSGHGAIKIQAVKGTLSFKGTLGDGTRLTATLAAGEDGSYRWYVLPYKKDGGYFGGWIRFVPITGDVAPYQVAGAGDSELYWEKSANAKHQGYRAGFGPVVLTATAQLWSAPSKGTPLSTALQLDSSEIESFFTSTSLTNEDVVLLPTNLALNDKNQFVVTAPAANSANLSVKARTINVKPNGAFTGKLTLQDNRKVSLAGVLLQQPEVNAGTVIGEGFFVIPPATKGDEVVHGNVLFLAP